METLKKIYHALPKFLRVPVKNVYRLWSNFVIWDESLVQALAEYCHLTLKETRWLMRNGGRLNGDLWLVFNPKTEEEKLRFYEMTPFYLFDLSYWHMTRTQRKFREAAGAIASGAVLDFGGGIGDFTLRLARKGLLVDYADVGGKTYDFARWLFAKNSKQIFMINLSRETVSKMYDTIFCIDVIEHVPNPREVAKDLAARLNPGGKLVITALTINEDSAVHPMHEKVDFDEGYLQSLGLFKGNQPWLFIKR